MRTLKGFELERLRACLRILMSKCIGHLCGDPVALAVLRGPWCYALFGLWISFYRHLEASVLQGESGEVPTVFLSGSGQSHMQ